VLDPRSRKGASGLVLFFTPLSGGSGSGLGFDAPFLFAGEPMQKLITLFVCLLCFVGQVKADGPAVKYIRLSMAIMDHGDCYLKIEETSSMMNTATKFQGDSITLDRLPRAEILKTAEGNYRIIHSFDPKDELNHLFPVNHNVQIDGIDGNLCFKTDKDVHAKATYWCSSKLPIIVSYDMPIVNANDGLLERFGIRNLGMLSINLIRKKEGNTLIGIFWNDQDKNETAQQNHILMPAEVDLTKEFDKKFRLPVPNSKIDDLCSFWFNAWAGTPKVARFLIQGHLSPTIGVNLKDKSSSVVFCEKVYPGGSAEQAGIKEGDIVISINGQETKTTQEALDILGRLSIGDELDFKIRRGEKEQEIKFAAE
jgi:hypothetical protein